MSTSSLTDLLRQPTNEEEEEEAGDFALQLARLSGLPMVLKAAIELDLFEIISKATKNGVNYLTPSQIASQLPTTNPNASSIIDRMLRLLASFSILKCELVTDPQSGDVGRAYGLGAVSKYFVSNEDGVSLAPFFLLLNCQPCTDAWYCLKDGILEGVTPFVKAHGKKLYEHAAEKESLQNMFNQGMHNYTAFTMNKFLKTYKGFEGFNKVVDVAGGLGANIAAIVSKYPHIQGVNFDLPHVVNDAKPHPGVEHIGGNMFEDVPKGDLIFLKWILHNWGDEECIKLLKNCYNALPTNGKVVIVDLLVEELPEDNIVSKIVSLQDLLMFNCYGGGKGRSEKEFKALANEAGFTAIKLVCCVYANWVIEFYK